MSTESKIYWGVGIVSVLLLVGTYFLPGKPSRADDVPWHIEHPAPDSVRVFGLTLGEATAGEAEERFREEGKPSMFKSPDGTLVAEMFFEQVDMAGLRSKVVVTIAVPETELKEMYERGLRMAATGSGKKITMTTDDVARLRISPISSLTYMPGVRVEEAMFLKRFGEPAMRIQEKKNSAVHWLYPQNGLDITLGGGEKPLLQYVPPKDFDRLLAPLKAEGEALK
ncbi:MAG TPA: hypothetical protein DCK83_07245 [Gallionellaceae bacterium]|nr:hypothetical protein [Gallionellaceae bacterium]